MVSCQPRGEFSLPPNQVASGTVALTTRNTGRNAITKR